MRDEVFEQCGEAGTRNTGLFTLTAPTGVGKTLALLHFALRHCLHTVKRRIIVVLPFLTLVEQNTYVYSEIIPDILEDHSQRELRDTEREFAARWRTPMIITTSVRFFESLFAQKPTDCRKLHNIANSVVLFDEAQSLPPNVTTATLQAVHALCSRYRCTMVFSTATQPDFSAIWDMEWAPTEILPTHPTLYAQLKRTTVNWRIKDEDKTPLAQIAMEMKAHNSVCTIVNLREHARILFRELRENCASDEVFFLTTDLCPAHRSMAVKQIKERLAQNLPCRAVATQCIEAGVDLDFDVLYRALAPLDSIIQAAGRCNRNGRSLQGGQVTVFVPDEKRLNPDDCHSNEKKRLYPGDWYSNAALLVKMRWMENGNQLDIHDPAQIQRYYRMLFQNATDDTALTEAIADRCFATVSEKYRLIENQGVQVIVPHAPMLGLYEEIRDEAINVGITPALLRKAAPITVTTFEAARRVPDSTWPGTCSQVCRLPSSSSLAVCVPTSRGSGKPT